MHRAVVAEPRLAVLIRPAALLFFLAVAVGCGGAKPEVTQRHRVSGIVSGLDDAATDPETFRAMFVDGAAPDETQRSRYAKYSYGTKSPEVSGNSAVATVAIREATTGKVLGEKEWTAEKVGGKWKLTSAPLPDGA